MPRHSTKIMQPFADLRRKPPPPAAGLHDPQAAKTWYFRDFPSYKYPVWLQHFLIGRGSLCEVSVRNDMVSARHAILHRRNEGFGIRDHDSTNGTYINGKRISVDDCVLITVGMRICLGPVKLIGVDENGRAPVTGWLVTFTDFCRRLVSMYGNPTRVAERLERPSREYIRQRCLPAERRRR